MIGRWRCYLLVGSLVILASGCIEEPGDPGGDPARGDSVVIPGDDGGEAGNGVQEDAAEQDCAPMDQYFEREVWAKVGEPNCVNCHMSGGIAGESRLILRTSVEDPDYLDHNLAAFEAMAREPAQGLEDLSRLVAKATGGLGHTGGIVVPPGTDQHGILETFAARVNDPDHCDVSDFYDPPEFFESVTMISDRRLLRRLTLSLGARLPHPEEIEQVDQEGLAAIAPIMDGLMTEDAFYERLMEGFNDILLTQGYEGPSELVLSWHHFRDTRDWPLGQEYAVFRDYRRAIRREPLELIAYIVRNNRPFTEIATADYMVVSPYTARGYDVFESVEDAFEDVDDPFEFVEVRLPALSDQGEQVQESPTGYYPHAGLLTTFQFMKRYPTTDTNRNRLRSNTFYKFFLGTDILDSAPLSADSAAADTQFANPTMEAPDCVVCHARLDPVAGLFQDYDDHGYFSPPNGGWYGDMFAPGFEGEVMAASERWRALQWLGQRTVEEQRFAVAMVEHVYQILFGRRVLAPPRDTANPLFDAHRRGYLMQRELIEAVATEFADNGFDLKDVFKALVVSPFYRADGLEEPIEDPRRRAEIADLGLYALLTPAQLDRQLTAIFGRTYFPLRHVMELLYGGIDSAQITERLSDPSGPMGAIQRIIANDIVCNLVPEEFHRPPEQRVFFADIEPDIRPDGSAEDRAKIRQKLIELQFKILGRELAAEDPEIERSYELFDDIFTEGNRLMEEGQALDRAAWTCAGAQPYRGPADPHYTIRAWRAVMTYMIRQRDFFYQ